MYLSGLREVKVPVFCETLCTAGGVLHLDVKIDSKCTYIHSPRFKGSEPLVHTEETERRNRRYPMMQMVYLPTRLPPAPNGMTDT